MISYDKVTLKEGGPEPSMTGVLIKRGSLDRQERKEDDMQGHRERTAIYRPRGDAWYRPFSHSLRRNQLCRRFDLGFLASRTVGQCITRI